MAKYESIKFLPVITIHFLLLCLMKAVSVLNESSFNHKYNSNGNGLAPSSNNFHLTRIRSFSVKKWYKKYHRIANGSCLLCYLNFVSVNLQKLDYLF